MQETINAIASSVDVLKSAAEELYGTVDSTAQLAAAQGMVYIEQALDGVRSGRKLSDYSDIGGAVQATRAGLASGVYATDFERRRDALVWAGKFAELGDLGESQLSIEERSLKALQSQIESLDALTRRADELVNGTSMLTGTVQGYFEKLLATLNKTGGATTPSPSPGRVVQFLALAEEGQARLRNPSTRGLGLMALVGPGMSQSWTRGDW